MKLIEPQAIRLLSSTVPENDAPAWDADTAYEIGDSVIHEHRVYKAVADSTGKQPDQHSEGTDAFWRLMGPTNRYAMLDQYVSTQTVAAEDVMTSRSESRRHAHRRPLLGGGLGRRDRDIER